MEVIPAIIGADFKEVSEKIEKVKKYTNWVQIDVVDGKFAPEVTWGVELANNLHLWETEDIPKVEMHFMVEKPTRFIDDFVHTSVDRILVHYESVGDLKSTIERIKVDGTDAGVVLNLDTPVDVVAPFVDDIAVIQLMSIAQIGHYGEPFDEKVLEKIKTLRKNFPNVTIQIDGGVTLESAQKAKEAGVNNIVVGSGIFKANNIEQAINEFNVV
jgi:ribulose-phosphate 3-epimerase|tara:strand:- start:85 stop:726 length:642 start_codon:yes stop_codon:yes gene_type:complete